MHVDADLPLGIGLSCKDFHRLASEVVILDYLPTYHPISRPNFPHPVCSWAKPEGDQATLSLRCDDAINSCDGEQKKALTLLLGGVGKGDKNRDPTPELGNTGKHRVVPLLYLPCGVVSL